MTLGPYNPHFFVVTPYPYAEGRQPALTQDNPNFLVVTPPLYAEGGPALPQEDLGSALVTSETLNFRATPIVEKKQGWGAWIASNGVRAVKNVWFKVSGFSVAAIKGKASQNLEDLRQMKGGSKLSQAVESLLPMFGSYLLSKLKTKKGIVELLVEIEEKDLKEIINALAVQMVFNWASHTEKKYPDSKELLVDMTRELIEIGKKHLPLIQQSTEYGKNKRSLYISSSLLVAELNALFLPNDLADILAPAPANRMIYDALQEMLYSEDLIRFFDTSSAKNKLNKSDHGKFILSLLPEAKEKLGGKFSKWAPGQDEFEEMLEGFLRACGINDSELLDWISGCYTEIVESDGFDAVSQLFVSIAEDIFLKIAQDVITPEKLPGILEKVAKFAHENKDELSAINKGKDPIRRERRAARLFKPLSDEILKILDWGDKKNLLIPDFAKPFVLPMLEKRVPLLLAQNYVGKEGLSELFRFNEERNKISESMSKNERAVAEKVSKLAVKIIISECPEIDESKPNALGAQQALQSLLKDTDIADIAATEMENYIDGATHKILHSLVETIRNREFADPEFYKKTTIALMNFTTKYLEVKNSGGQFDVKSPEFQVLSRSMLETIGLSKDKIPVPEEMKDKVWNDLIEKFMPTAIDFLYKTYLTPEFIDEQMIDFLKLDEVEYDPAPKDRAIDDASGALGVQIVKFFKLPFKGQLTAKRLGSIIGGMVADRIKAVPLSGRVEEILGLVAELDFDKEPVKKEYDPKVLSDFLGSYAKKIVRKSTADAIMSPWKSIQNAFDRAIKNTLGTYGLKAKHGLDALFRAIGTVIWYVVAYLPTLVILSLLDLYIQRTVNRAVAEGREKLDKDFVTRVLGEGLALLKPSLDLPAPNQASAAA